MIKIKGIDFIYGLINRKYWTAEETFCIMKIHKEMGSRQKIFLPGNIKKENTYE